MVVSPSPPINPLHAIYCEMLALRIVVQRLLGQIAVAQGPNARNVMRAEHGHAMIAAAVLG